MNRNQKIALGCGGAGCLGLILVVIVVAILIGMGIIAAPGITSYTDTNSNSNSNSNYNAPSNRNSNTNTNSNSSSSSSMSSDAKHKLFQAGAATNDASLNRRVWDKLGLLNADGSANDEYGSFFRDHISWIFANRDFIQSINTPEKARAYVENHLED